MHWRAIDVAVFVAAGVYGAIALTDSHEKSAAITEDALKAAPSYITDGATVKDLDGNVVRKGSTGWTCYPGPNLRDGKDAMCHDPVWDKWMKAWTTKSDFKADRISFSYMLAGDEGASNIDPYAAGPTPDNDWIVEGPHVMMLLPDPSMLEGISTDPHNGGPYVMWKGTPYAHIMWPVGSR